MKFFKKEYLDQIQLPFSINGIENNLQLKYLLNSVYGIASKTNAESAITPKLHLFLAEDYDNLTGHIPLYFLLYNRLKDFKNKFNCNPNQFRTEWNPVKYIVDNGHEFLRLSNNDVNKTQEFDKLIVSLLQQYGNNKIHNIKDCQDNNSIIFFTNSVTQEEQLLRNCSINGYNYRLIFNNCRIDNTHTWDNNSSLINSRLYCIDDPDYFRTINNNIPIKNIVITFEAIESYINILPQTEGEEDTVYNKISLFFENLQNFINYYNILNIVITAPAEKCLLLQKYLEIISNNQALNFFIGEKHVILKNDFIESTIISQPIHTRLKYQYKYEIFNNIINDFENFFSYLENNYGSSQNLHSLKNIFYELKLKLFSLLPSDIEIDSSITLFKNSIDNMQIQINDKENINNKVNFLINYLINNSEEYASLIENIGGEYITIYSDNYYDYSNNNNQEYNLEDKIIRVKQIDWNKINCNTDRTIIYCLKIPRNITGNIYNFLFRFIVSSPQLNSKIYFLMSNTDLLIIRNIINSFERCLESFRPNGDFFHKICVLDLEELEHQVALSNINYVENLDDYIRGNLINIIRGNVGIPRLYPNNQLITVNIQFIDISNNDDVFIYDYEVPGGRIYNFIDNNDDNENFRKRADELESGDCVLVIFNDRDNTYDSIRELLIERNTNNFKTKNKIGSIWLDALKLYKDQYSIAKLSNIIGFPIGRIRYWFRKIHVMPDDFDQLLNKILILINENTDIYPPGLIMQFGNLSEYIKTYDEVYFTPRIIYRKILNIICGREELNYQIVGYEDVYEELRLQSRILKVINVE